MSSRLVPTRPSRRLRVLAAVALVVLGGGWFGIGQLLVREDPLEHADVIYVLGGAWTNRWLESVDLYKQGWAPLILMSAGAPEGGDRELAARGVHMPSGAEVGRDVMVTQLGIPPAAVAILPDEVDSTKAEALAFRDRARTAGWHSVIVITDAASTRRAGIIFRRKLGAPVHVIMRSSAFDGFDAAHWWRTRGGLRTVFFEAPKLVVYWLGLAG